MKQGRLVLTRPVDDEHERTTIFPFQVSGHDLMLRTRRGRVSRPHSHVLSHSHLAPLTHSHACTEPACADYQSGVGARDPLLRAGALGVAAPAAVCAALLRCAAHVGGGHFVDHRHREQQQQRRGRGLRACCRSARARQAQAGAARSGARQSLAMDAAGSQKGNQGAPLLPATRALRNYPLSSLFGVSAFLRPTHLCALARACAPLSLAGRCVYVCVCIVSMLRVCFAARGLTRRRLRVLLLLRSHGSVSVASCLTRAPVAAVETKL